MGKQANGPAAARIFRCRPRFFATAVIASLRQLGAVLLYCGQGLLGWANDRQSLIVAKHDFAGKLCDADIRDHMEKFVSDGVISRLAIPQKILLVEALERTSVGKLTKRPCAKNIADRPARLADDDRHGMTPVDFRKLPVSPANCVMNGPY